MRKNPRLDIGQLADLRDGRLAPEASERAERALADDPEAQATDRWLRGFGETAAAIPLQPGSALLEQRLKQHFARWIQAQEVLSAPSEQIRAELTYDSRRDRSLTGVRGAAYADETISLVWECEHGELSIEVLPDEQHDDQVRLLGQVLLNADSDAPIFEAAAVTEGSRRVAESDEFGRFRIEQVRRSDTELKVGNGLLEISATIELGDPRRSGQSGQAAEPPDTPGT